MFVSRIYVVGNDYRARAAARRLGLGRSSYSLRGEVVGYGPEKGKPRESSLLMLALSESDNHERHMRQVEERLGELMTFLSGERRRYGDTISIRYSVGMTVGGEEDFIRSFWATPTLMSQLVALGIHLSINAYPCSDRTKRSRLKWTDGIGLMPGLGR